MCRLAPHAAPVPPPSTTATHSRYRPCPRLQAGDVIWMAPYVPQWYAALGSEVSRYILYKDVTLDPIHGA